MGNGTTAQLDRGRENLAMSALGLWARILDDQTQVYSKPAGQPGHASLNQCQLIAANGCQNWFSGHPQLLVEIRFRCNVIDAGTLIGPCPHVASHCCLIW